MSNLSGINYLSETEKDMLNFVKDKLSNLSEFKTEEYPNKIFYMNSDGGYILEYDIKNMYLWVRYKNFWEVLEEKYKVEHYDIEILIKYMVESAYKLKVETSIVSESTMFH